MSHKKIKLWIPKWQPIFSKAFRYKTCTKSLCVDTSQEETLGAINVHNVLLDSRALKQNQFNTKVWLLDQVEIQHVCTRSNFVEVNLVLCIFLF